MQLSPLRHRRLAKPRLPTLTGKTWRKMGKAETGKRKGCSPYRTYRIEYTDDLTTHQWHPLTDPIPGDVGTLSVVEGANP